MYSRPLHLNIHLFNRTSLAGKAVIALLLILLTSSLDSPQVMAEGSPQVMPNPLVNGVGMYIGNGTLSGPYRGAPSQNRLHFYINNHVTENLYFNVKVYNRSNNLQIPVYYRILDAANTQIVGATQITTLNQISTYAQTVAGPNIGGAAPTGYTPFSFNPEADGEYYIEIYQSSDFGATPAFNQDVLVTLFDFTVATTANVRSTGRVYSQSWSLLSYNPATNIGSINNSLESDFYGYTSDSTVVKLDLQTGFRPFGFILYMNKYGAVNGSNWISDRRSQNTGVSAPSLPNGYLVFLNAPDAVHFPISTVATAPQFGGNINGCASNLSIPYYIDKPGDVAILLDINGTPGYQSGTSDRLLNFTDVPVGHNIGTWNGLDGLGNAVGTATAFNLSLSIQRGRVNIPMYDAELNSFGLNVTGVSPIATIPRLYFDDALLTNTALTTCAVTADGNTNNNTGTGITNSNVGVPSPGRAWDGAGSGNAVPAPIGGGGSATSLTCDDYGNLRTINTWFWAYEVSSAVYAVSIPACSADGNATLPLTLVKFSAEKKVGNAILVSWQAQHEASFKEYVLERSTNGINYTTVAIVPGKGGQVPQYAYIDNTRLETGAKLYYRLRQVDINNRFTYSRILSVSLTPIKGITLLVTPNPAGNNVALKIYSDKKRTALVNIVDNQGRIVAAQRISIANGDNIIALADVSRLINGAYTVLVNTGEERLLEKLVIQK